MPAPPTANFWPTEYTTELSALHDARERACAIRRRAWNSDGMSAASVLRLRKMEEDSLRKAVAEETPATARAPIRARAADVTVGVFLAWSVSAVYGFPHAEVELGPEKRPFVATVLGLGILLCWGAATSKFLQ